MNPLASKFIFEYCLPMDIQNLKKDLKALFDEGRGKQLEVSNATGISQTTLSLFANDPKRDIAFSKACKLIPFVYPGKDPIGPQDREG